jgi:hypothetical protein
MKTANPIVSALRIVRLIVAILTGITGKPDWDHVSAPFIECRNPTMRMHLRRLTRLTNAFSKKWEKLSAMLALYFAWYNFCRVHQTLRVIPAMEAGISDHIWEIKELLEVVA